MIDGVIASVAHHQDQQGPRQRVPGLRGVASLARAKPPAPPLRQEVPAVGEALMMMMI